MQEKFGDYVSSCFGNTDTVQSGIISRKRIQREQPVIAEKERFAVARVKAWGDLSDVVRHERERRVLDLWVGGEV